MKVQTIEYELFKASVQEKDALAIHEIKGILGI
ncbi:hypothetical protein QFZ77_006496 [Paenibacillus sp. V4I3]|nr:hypothetical protein [Paenibacillus sp. V4I3]